MKTHTNILDALKEAAKQLCPGAETIHDLDPNSLIMKETAVTDESGKKVKIVLWYLDPTGLRSAEVYYIEDDVKN